MQVLQWNPWVLKIFVYFLSSANESETMFRNIPIRRGQLLRSLNTMIEDLKYPVEQMTIDKRDRYYRIPKRTLERYLNYMTEVADLIEKQVTRVGLLISVKNYDALCKTPLTGLALLDTKEVAFIKQKNGSTQLQGNALLQHARDIQLAWGEERALSFCRSQRMCEEDIERALRPVPIPSDLKSALKAKQ